jgi:hypothetical protein
VKYSIFCVNFLVCVVGAAILALSLALVFSKNFQNDVMNVVNQAGGDGSAFNSLTLVFYITAGIGGLIFLTGFLGCCGAACENTCCLGIFFAIVLVLFLAELGVGITALVKKGSFKDDFDTFYSNTVIPNYIKGCKQNPITDPLVDSWNTTQNKLQCCGCTGYSDYKGETCSARLLPCDQSYKVGCCDKVWSEINDNLTIVGGVAVGLLVIELLAMIFSCCLCKAVQQQHYRSVPYH